MSYSYELFTDPSFMGAFLGAIITGMIALSVFFLQKKQSIRSEKEHYRKVYVEIKGNLPYLIGAVDIFKDFIVENNMNKEEMRVCDALFQSLSTKLNDIKKEDVPYEIFEIFYAVKDSLETVKLCSNIYLDVGRVAFLREDLFKSIESLKINLRLYHDYFQDK